VSLDSSLAVHCFTEQIVITESPGDYHINVSLLQGGNPVAGNGLFHLSEHPAVQNKGEYIYVCEIPETMRNILIKWGYQVQELVDKQDTEPAIILLGDATEFLPEAGFWKALQIQVQKGSIVLFLSHHIFESHPQFPFEISPALRSFLKGQIIHCNDWLYHKECIAKGRPLFSDLPKPGIMDWYYYGPFITHEIFRPNELPADIAAAAFAVGYSCQGGYYSGILSCRYKMDQGGFIINTFPILEQWLLHPVAEQMLSNYLTDCEKIIKSK
jgi:hypothetical protein